MSGDGFFVLASCFLDSLRCGVGMGSDLRFGLFRLRSKAFHRFFVFSRGFRVYLCRCRGLLREARLRLGTLVFQPRGGFLRLFTQPACSLRCAAPSRESCAVRSRVSCSSCGASHRGNSFRSASAAAACEDRACPSALCWMRSMARFASLATSARAAANFCSHCSNEARCSAATACSGRQ